MAKEYTLPDLVEAIIEHNLWDLHTCLPAHIVEIDHKKQKATVRPLIKGRDRDAGGSDKGLQNMAVIQGVPIVFPSANTGILTFPIKIGDIVLVVFSERSIDNFVFSDGDKPVDPADLRKHDYTDAFCIAGLYPFKRALGIHETDTVLRMNVNSANECTLSLKPNGDIVVDTPNKFIVNAKSNVEINTDANTQVDVSGNAIVNVEGSTTLTSNGFTINSDVIINGNQSISGVSTATDHISGGKSGSTHVHGGVASGGGVTAPPT